MVYSVNYPKKPIDHKKWSMWLRDAREWAKDRGLIRIPESTYRTLFDKGVTPKKAAEYLAGCASHLIRDLALLDKE